MENLASLLLLGFGSSGASGQKVKLLDELDDLQRNSIYVLIDTAIANKRLKEALSNAKAIRAGIKLHNM